MSKRKEYEETISFLLEKTKKKEVAKPNILLSPTKRDDPTKPYLINDDKEEIKKVEKFTKEMADKIK